MARKTRTERISDIDADIAALMAKKDRLVAEADAQMGKAAREYGFGEVDYRDEKFGAEIRKVVDRFRPVQSVPAAASKAENLEPRKAEGQVE